MKRVDSEDYSCDVIIEGKSKEPKLYRQVYAEESFKVITRNTQTYTRTRTHEEKKRGNGRKRRRARLEQIFKSPFYLACKRNVRLGKQ